MHWILYLETKKRGKEQIVKDGVIQADFIFSSSGYLAECENFLPVKGVYAHISGFPDQQSEPRV